MNLTRRGLRRMGVLAPLTLLVGVGMLSLPSALQAHSPTPPPLDFDRYLVFMANGVFSPEEMMRDGATFQHGVMGRSPEEVAANKAEAVAFFAERFGVDFSTSDHVQGINLFGFELTPDANYRAYTISGETLPSDGWVVRDGGWAGLVGPEGITFHGTWGGAEGRDVPPGTIIVFGEYNIRVERPGNAPDRHPIVVPYRSGEPMITDAQGRALIVCDLVSPEFGEGRALGYFAVEPVGDGLVQATVRNVLTFPGNPPPAG
jgi:hypothetical protein